MFKFYLCILKILILNRFHLIKRSHILFKLIAVLFFVSITKDLYSQNSDKTGSKCEMKSIQDFFRIKDSALAVRPLKNHFFIVFPLIGSQPATGFSYGFTAQFAFKGKEEKDKFSAMYMNAQYSEKKQLMFSFVDNLLLNKNKLLLNGDFRYYFFTQSNFGLGSDIVPHGSASNGFDLKNIEQPMEYNYFKLHQTVSFLVKHNLYLGGGIHIDSYSKINDQMLDLENGFTTYHYDYNSKNNFSLDKYSVNGLSLNLVYDSRDNQINASHGRYFNLNYRINPHLNKIQENSNMLFAEYRHFFPLSKKSKQHVLGFWTYGQFVTNGKLPYLNLPAIGWDQRSRSGKGYTQGLFRGNNLVYFETEYRFPILCNELISGTVFANMVTVSDEQRLTLFHTLQPACGISLRILLDKATRTNFIISYAKGHKSDGFYLNSDESF